MPLKLSDTAVMALRTLDPAAPLDDLDWLDEAIGDARVVAIGETAHGIREFYQLRHRLVRYLVERRRFDTYAMESGFVEGWRVNDWVHGGDDELSQVGHRHYLPDGVSHSDAQPSGMDARTQSQRRTTGQLLWSRSTGLVCVIAAGHRRGDRLPAPG